MILSAIMLLDEFEPGGAVTINSQSVQCLPTTGEITGQQLRIYDNSAEKYFPLVATNAADASVVRFYDGVQTWALQAVQTGTAQTITFGALPAKTYGNAPFALTATSDSGLSVSYTSSNTAVATVAGSTVTIVGVGTTNITASQAGDGTWAAATPVVQALTVNKADQTIGWTGVGIKLYTASPFTVTATASSGLATAVITVVSGPATINVGTVTLTGDLGTVVLRTSQAGDANYNATGNVDASFDVVETLAPPGVKCFGIGFRRFRA